MIFKGGLQNASPVFFIFFKTLKSTENVFILFDKVAKLSICQYAIWQFFPISSILKIKKKVKWDYKMQVSLALIV